ncbi:hypothetical protein FKM82_015247 [Ascaphus truei]
MSSCQGFNKIDGLLGNTNFYKGHPNMSVEMENLKINNSWEGPAEHIHGITCLIMINLITAYGVIKALATMFFLLCFHLFSFQWHSD